MICICFHYHCILVSVSKQSRVTYVQPPSVCQSVWQWKGDDGEWEPYSASDCVLLDSAVASQKSSVTLSLGSGRAYEVDLKKMVQINPVTKYKRKIRCQTIKPGAFILYGYGYTYLSHFLKLDNIITRIFFFFVFLRLSGSQGWHFQL